MTDATGEKSDSSCHPSDTSVTMNHMDKDQFEHLTNRIRYDILRITHKAGSGHPTSCFSAVDLMAVLYFKYLRFDITRPAHPANDRVIFSKGHSSALLYALYAAADAVSGEQLLTYRDFKSPLEGHSTFRFPFTEAATGSLGQGLPVGAGMAWALMRKTKSDEREARGVTVTRDQTIVVESAFPEIPFYVPRVFVLLGDGECAEGSVWEAAAWAAKRRLNNLIAIVDINRLGQSDATMPEWDMDAYRKRFESFGWGAIVIDGHEFAEIDAAYEKALVYKGGPTAILAKTVKGRGIPIWEDKNGWHNRMLPPEELAAALKVFEKDQDVRGMIAKPDVQREETRDKSQVSSVKYQAAGQNLTPDTLTPDTYTSLIATKTAFGDALTSLGKQIPNLVVLDGDVANSLSLEKFKQDFPDRFLEMYIAEQNMAGVAIGLARRGYLPVVNTFAAFLSRAYDFIRMMPLSEVTVLINGGYGGVSLGKDGPSQMGLEDLAIMRAVSGSTVLYPGDPYQTAFLARLMTERSGVVYIRTTREPTPVIYTPADTFEIGGSHVFRLKGAAKESATVIGAGITVHEALKAQAELAKEQISIRVIDCYSVKPVDEKTIRKAAEETKHIIIVEDHYPEGGLGDAVKSVLAGTAVQITHLAVTKLPMSGKPDELLQYEGIDARAVMEAVRGA